MPPTLGSHAARVEVHFRHVIGDHFDGTGTGPGRGLGRRHGRESGPAGTPPPGLGAPALPQNRSRERSGTVSSAPRAARLRPSPAKLRKSARPRTARPSHLDGDRRQAVTYARVARRSHEAGLGAVPSGGRRAGVAGGGDRTARPRHRVASGARRRGRLRAPRGGRHAPPHPGRGGTARSDRLGRWRSGPALVPALRLRPARRCPGPRGGFGSGRCGGRCPGARRRCG